jgi:hypothetical protein
MVDRIQMNKGVALGYGNLDDLELLGRSSGFDIYVETVESTAITVWVYDRNVTKRMRRGTWLAKDDSPNMMETRYRIPAKIGLSKVRGAWHVDLLQVDSRYKGKNLAIKTYKFLMNKMDITLKAGSNQSAGGRYVWNKLAKAPGVMVYAKKSPYSKVFDFPKTGNRELVGNMFNLYDSAAEIFAVAG